MIDIVEKWRQVALLEAMDLQEKSLAAVDNPQFNGAAIDKLKEAADFEVALRVLRGLNDNQQFIARIEL